MDLKNLLLLSFVYWHALICELALGKSKSTTHNNVIFKQNDKECNCFENKQHLKTVPQVLDPKHQGIERLVIFVYKKLNDPGHIYTYIPNRDKQSILPDLPHEDGGLTLDDGEKLATIFSNSKMAIKYLHYGYDLQDSKVLGNEVEADRNLPGYHINEIESQNLLYNPNGSGALDHHIQQPNDTKLLSAELHDEGKLNQDESTYGTAEPVDYEPDISGSYEDNHSTNFVYPESLTLIKQDKGPTGYVLPLQNTELNKTGSLIETDENAHHLKYIEDSHIVKDSVKNVHIPSKNTTDSSRPGFLLGPISKKNVSSVIFDKWIKNQLQNMERVNSTKHIDYQLLKHLIREILQKHGMIVSPTGALIDTDGQVLDINNLQLRPLLIGDNIEYKKVAANLNGTYSLPQDTPYLEALLISFLYPPKIIGIVPLGKTYLPKSFISKQPLKKTDLISEPSSITETDKHSSKGIHTQTESIKKKIKEPLKENGHVLALLQKSENTNKTNVESEKVSKENISEDISWTFPEEFQDARRKLKFKVKYIKPEKNKKKEFAKKDISAESDLIINEAEKYLKKRLFGFVGPIVQQIKKRVHIHPQQVLISENDTSASEDDQDIDDYFRIIGGKAATGSGSPINNRGRSGFIEKK